MNKQQTNNNEDLATAGLIYFNTLVFSRARVLVAVTFIMHVSCIVIFFPKNCLSPWSMWLNWLECCPISQKVTGLFLNQGT